MIRCVLLLATSTLTISAAPKEFPENADVARSRISAYEANPSIFSGQSLLDVARSYVYEQRWAQAKAVYERYVKENPEEPFGYRGLASVQFVEGKREQAIALYQKAWQLGDVKSLKMLASISLNRGHLKQVKELLPSLLKHKEEDIEIRNALMVYAQKVEPPDKDLFMKAIDGLSDEEIIKREDTQEWATKGLRAFGDEARAAAIESKAKGNKKQTDGR